MTNDQLTALLTNNDKAKIITALKGIKPEIKLDELKKQFSIQGHAVLDVSKRPNKKVETDEGTSMEYVNRIAVSLQELICERAVSFLFGSPVKIQCDPLDENENLILKALNRVLKDNKMDSFSAEVALELFRSTEVAECWFVVPVKKTYKRYGFDSKAKVKCTMFSPWNGDVLYPLFSDTGDLIAFSREYIVSEEGKKVTYFETYTDEVKQVWKKVGQDWEAEEPITNVIGKIPIVYASQTGPEWENVQPLIDRIEKLLSNHADTTDYHASPTLFAKGEITIMPKKGESGKLIAGDALSELSYVSLDQAPEMVKFEYDTLLSLVYALSQTPNISFEAMKGLGDISGVAFDRLFVDAKLKVKKKRRIFDAYLERRTNLILALLSTIKTNLSDTCDIIDIDAVVQPFTFEDQKEMVDTLTTAVSGGILSKKTAVKLSGLVDDVDKEFDQITEEEATANTLNIAPGAI
jgi:SPP1 family phage portal protein